MQTQQLAPLHPPTTPVGAQAPVRRHGNPAITGAVILAVLVAFAALTVFTLVSFANTPVVGPEQITSTSPVSSPNTGPDRITSTGPSGDGAASAERITSSNPFTQPRPPASARPDPATNSSPE